MQLSDLGIRLKIPYNRDINLIHRLIAYRENIDSVYLAPGPEIFPTSGAILVSINDKKEYEKELAGIIDLLKSHGIKTYLLLNATNFDPEIVRGYERSELRKYLRKMVKEYGLEKAVIFSIPLAQRIKEDLPELGLEVSITAGVDSLEKARYWQDAVDIESICVHQRLNKKIAKLKMIKEKTGLKITIIGDNGCLVNCPNEIFHNNITTYAGYHKSSYDCHSVLEASPWLVFSQAKIVPANLKYYKGVIDIVKLEGRWLPTERILSAVHHYSMELDSYYYENIKDTNIGTFPYYHPYKIGEEPAGIFAEVVKCDNDCESCGKCQKAWEQYYGFGEKEYLCIEIYNAIGKRDYKRAVEKYEEYKGSGGVIDGHLEYAIGTSYKELKEYEKAIEHMSRSEKSRPEIRKELGICYYHAGRYRESVIEMEGALMYEEGKEEIYKWLGMGYEALGEYDKGIRMLERALVEGKRCADGYDLRFYMGLCLLGKGQVSGAKEKFLESIEIDRSRWDAHTMLGRIYYGQRELKKAEDELKESLRLNEKEWSSYNVMGAIYREAGRFEEAERMLKEAIRLKEDEWSNHNIMGNVYKMMCREEEADKEYREALKLCSEEEYRKKIEAKIREIELRRVQ